MQHSIYQTVKKLFDADFPVNPLISVIISKIINFFYNFGFKWIRNTIKAKIFCPLRLVIYKQVLIISASYNKCYALQLVIYKQVQCTSASSL